MTLYLFALISALNQALHTGGRVAVALTALHLDASPWVLGSITALYGLLPALLSLAVGRLNDRIGSRAPLFAGTLMFAIGGLVPSWHPSLGSLYLAATLIGLGNMIFQVSIQNAVGYIGRHEDRTRNFSTLAIGTSTGAMLGPLIAGYGIDYAGYEPAFIFLALLPITALILLSNAPLELHQPDRHDERASGSRRAAELLSNRPLRAVYLITVLLVVSWELFTFLMPVHGSRAGLSASTIGIVMGAFSAASLSIRATLPPLARRFPPWTLIKTALAVGGLMFVAIPAFTQAPMLIVLAFVLGAALGTGQPLTMTLMHEAAPAGRVGESLGIRNAVVCSFQTAMPLVFGGLGTALGMLPVFWATAAVLWVGVALTRTGPR